MILLKKICGFSKFNFVLFALFLTLPVGFDFFYLITFLEWEIWVGIAAADYLKASRNNKLLFQNFLKRELHFNIQYFQFCINYWSFPVYDPRRRVEGTYPGKLCIPLYIFSTYRNRGEYVSLKYLKAMSSLSIN